MSASRIVAAAFAVALLVPGAAFAAQGWAWPLGSSVALPYGAVYTAADGRRCTHGGIDIPAPTGTDVGACAPGTVTFAGLVPAGPGRRTTAVTVATDDGLHVTYLPLERAAVRAGSRVAQGERIGQLADVGDGSSTETHLHLGVRRGSRSLDPLSMLGGQASAPAPTPAPKPPARPVTPKGPSTVHSTESPANSATSIGGRAVVARPLPSATLDSLQKPGPVAVSEFESLRVTAGASLRAVSALPAPRALPIAAVPIGARLLAAARAASRARHGVAWIVLRLLLAAAGVLCLRPVIGALRKPVDVGSVAVRRVRI